MKHRFAPRARLKAGGLRQRAWWVMRRRRVFTLPDLLTTLADGTEADAKSNLGKYLRALARAGILACEADRQPGAALTSNGHLRYRLVVDSGRQAPVWRNSRRDVYDPNTGTIYPIGDEASRTGAKEPDHELA